MSDGPAGFASNIEMGDDSKVEGVRLDSNHSCDSVLPLPGLQVVSGICQLHATRKPTSV